MAKKIAVFIGSLRKESWNRKVVLEMMRLAPESLDFKLIEIGDLPFYNEDLEQADKLPETWKTFRNEMKSVDGVLFVTPEYNRSIPAVIKNALDVGSRPYGQSVWQHKPGAIISVTQGGLGAFGANHALRQSMVFLDVPMMQQPEMYIAHVASLFEENNHVNDKTEAYFKNFLSAFEKWVNLF